MRRICYPSGFKMSSGFVTETELAEARRLRQEEWEKVRTADQPEGKFSFTLS